MAFTGVGPGKRTLEGLAWLARVGVSPMEPLELVMGWSERTALDHVRRLVDAGLVRRLKMWQGQGSLVLVTSKGATRAGHRATRAPRSLGPSGWEHAIVCAWVGAWLQLRGRTWWSEREVGEDDFWSRTVTYQDRRGLVRVEHRPKLAAQLDGYLPIEIELRAKPRARLLGTMRMYQELIGDAPDEPFAGVVYITGNETLDVTLRKIAEDAWLYPPALQFRSFGLIVEQARAAAAERRPPQ